jgi:Zn-dependent peptidase ImmA (M78 family)
MAQIWDYTRWSAALDRTVEHLLDETDIAVPPVNALLVAQRLDVTVALDRTLTVRGRHKRLSGNPAIFLRPEERPERLQWAAAHELGEVFAWRVFEELEADPDPDSREQLANLIAPRLLIPSRWFHNDVLLTGGDLIALKSRYRTASHELIAWRFLDLPQPSIVTVFDHEHVSRRRGSRNAQVPGVQPIERRCWETVHRTAEPARLRQPGILVEGWPVHEPGWKREVLRTSPDEEWG